MGHMGYARRWKDFYYLPREKIRRGLIKKVFSVFSVLFFAIMVKHILFLDVLRQEEINMFYDVAQMHREYYKGYPKRYHPFTYFREPEYSFQCPPEMSQVYLNFPPFHVRYKQPSILPATLDRTSGMPQLPNRSLAARFNKPPCKAYMR